MSGLGAIGKRTIDFVGALVGIVLLAPVFIVIAIIVQYSSPGPIFFRQLRVGRYSRPFYIYKYRSMRIDAEHLLREDPDLWQTYVANGFKLPEGEDPRITPIGRWLRKTSLDELPQLWNVLQGDMSLVGPRPLVPQEIDQWYGNRAAILLSVRPGMTGLWQVSGRSEIPYPDRADMELEYVHRQTLWFDVSVLVRTVLVVIRGRGAY